MKLISLTALSLTFLCVPVLRAQSTQSIFPLMPASVSTVPSNGDVNRYGIAFVPANLPPGPGLQAGDILVTNFNNSENLQGTGTTIVRITKGGQVSTFFTSPQQFGGLSVAIGILSDGLVFVGCLPTADGTSATAQPRNREGWRSWTGPAIFWARLERLPLLMDSGACRSMTPEMG